MAEIDMRFSPRLVLGSLSHLGNESLDWGKQALLLADSSMEDTASLLQQKLDNRNVNTIVYARDGLADDTETLTAVLSLARGSRARMVVALGGESVMSLGRLAAAAAPGTLNANDVIGGALQADGDYPQSLPCLEIPGTGRHSLLFRSQATLSDTETRRVAMLSLPSPPTRIVFIDASLPASLPVRQSSLSIATVLMSAVESFLSPRASFLSDVQSRYAVEAASALLNRVGKESFSLEYRTDEAEASVMSALATGFTSPGPGALLSRALAAAAGIPAAAVSAVLLPWILESPLYAGSPRLGELAALLSTDSDYSKNPAETLRAVFGRLGLPGRLREIGADLSEIIDCARSATVMLGYQRTDLDQNSFREILELAS